MIRSRYAGKLEKSLNDEKIKIFLEIQIKQNTQQLVSDSITLYSTIERDKKTVPVRCINRLWSALKELAESEKHWENWIYEKNSEHSRWTTSSSKNCSSYAGSGNWFFWRFLT